MLITPAYAQAAGGGDTSSMLVQLAPLALIFVVFYFFLIRPQQQRAREHANQVNAVKRGDTVVLSSGVIGKVVRVEDTELGVEIAQNVSIKVIKSMVSEVRTRGEPVAANDAKK